MVWSTLNMIQNQTNYTKIRVATSKKGLWLNLLKIYIYIHWSYDICYTVQLELHIPTDSVDHKILRAAMTQ